MTIGLPTIHPAASVAMQNLNISIKEPFCCCQDIKVRIESIKASERYIGQVKINRKHTAFLNTDSFRLWAGRCRSTYFFPRLFTIVDSVNVCKYIFPLHRLYPGIFLLYLRQFPIVIMSVRPTPPPLQYLARDI